MMKDARRKTWDERRGTKDEGRPLALLARMKDVDVKQMLFFVFVPRPSSYVLRYKSGQSMIEFTFAMMVTLLLIYALFMVFRWAGMDLAERRFAHEHLLTNEALRPEQQLNPDFFKPRKIEGAFRGFDLKK